jgi:hypothetical protein
MFEKQGVLMLGKQIGGDQWFAYYLPFINFGSVLDLTGTPILLSQSADWINECYQTEPETLIRLRKQIADGTVHDFYMFEVAPKQ